jgi:hypothetical protein
MNLDLFNPVAVKLQYYILVKVKLQPDRSLL